MWEAVKRKSHLGGGVMIQWIVVRAGAMRGICECWEEADARRIAGALNASEMLTGAGAGPRAVKNEEGGLRYEEGKEG